MAVSRCTSVKVLKSRATTDKHYYLLCRALQCATVQMDGSAQCWVPREASLPCSAHDLRLLRTRGGEENKAALTGTRLFRFIRAIRFLRLLRVLRVGRSQRG